ALIKNYDGKDPWMLEAIGTASEGKEDKIYSFIKEHLKSDPEYWTAARANLTWRLHPARAVPELRQRAEASKVDPKERRKALTAIGFIKTKSAAEAMIALSKSALPDVSSQALWWLNFRKTNDWSALMDWDETEAQVMTPAYRKML